MIKTIGKLLDPVGKGHYKVLTTQTTLNQLLADYVVPEAEDIEELRFEISKAHLHIRGVVPKQQGWKSRLGRIHFDLSLLKDEIKEHEVFFRIKKFTVRSPETKADPIKWIGKCSHTVHRQILDGLCAEHTPFYEDSPLRSIRFDLNDVLARIPSEASLLGNLRILNVGLEPEAIVWYLESNIILRSVIDYLGARYVTVSKIDENADAIKLLTELSFNDLST